MSTSVMTVATPEIGGVRIKRHLLDRETAGLAELAQKLGHRLRVWLRTMPDVSVVRVVGRDETGMNIEVPVMDDRPLLPDGTANPNHGKQVIAPWMPDGEWRETYELYGKIILSLLREQRERAKLVGKQGAPPVSDEEFEQQLRQLAAETIRQMPKAELEALLAERKDEA